MSPEDAVNCASGDLSPSISSPQSPLPAATGRRVALATVAVISAVDPESRTQHMIEVPAIDPTLARLNCRLHYITSPEDALVWD